MKETRRGYCDVCSKKFISTHNFGIVWNDTFWTLELVTYGHPVYHGKLFCSRKCAYVYAYQNKISLINKK